jgi:hypothetical protein
MTRLANNHPVPGLRSPLFYVTFLLGAGLFLSSETDADYTLAKNVLVIAATCLVANNKIIRGVSIAGGAMRIFGSGSLGMFMQATSLGYGLIKAIERYKEYHSNHIGRP